MLSKNIKALRIQKGYTQKELAELLHVTSQAVSRWEQGDVEPSIDTISNMAKIFEVTTDEIIGGLENKPKKENIEEKENSVAEQVKPVLAVCENCNKPIYDGKDIIRKGSVVPTENGLPIERVKVICSECNEKEEEENYENIKNYSKGLRIKTFVLCGIISAIILISWVAYLITESASVLDVFSAILVSASIFTFMSCLCLKNNFICNMFFSVASWGFVTFPGLIFDLSLDGILWLIGMKIIFWLLGILIGLLTTLLAIFICLPLSLFAYPFALIKNIKYPEKTEID